ncbi:MAG: peptidoglycan DD-metalloendopeptidase family protein [Luteimonas sp.]
MEVPRVRSLRRVAVVALPVVAAASLAACGTARVVNAPVASHPRPVQVSQPRPGATAVVQRGDSVYRIATSHGISPLDLAMWNDIPPPYTIYPGQHLRLYPSERGTHSPPVASGPARPRVPATAPPTPSVLVQPVVVPAASPFAWSWPADGALLSRYVTGEPTSQGIDIAGASGQPVRAAADGVVVYSGSGLVGYGELIIVKHNDAWLSAYGHNRARLVNEGQLVKAGQQIAEMGHSGAARDMLHFEIRFNGKPVDPLLYLPRR